MAGSYDRYMFIFFRNCQTVLHRAKPFLFSYHSVRELSSSIRSSNPATSDSFSFLTFIKVCRNTSLHFVFSLFQWLILLSTFSLLFIYLFLALHISRWKAGTAICQFCLFPVSLITILHCLRSSALKAIISYICPIFNLFSFEGKSDLRYSIFVMKKS